MGSGQSRAQNDDGDSQNFHLPCQGEKYASFRSLERGRDPESSSGLGDAAPKGLTVPPPLMRRARRQVSLYDRLSVVIILALAIGEVAASISCCHRLGFSY
jgi:hypothetical protein